jgi:hypothetical protein
LASFLEYCHKPQNAGHVDGLGGNPNGASSSSSPRLDLLPPGILKRGASDTSQKDQTDEFAPIIASVGRPEKEDSTQYDRPRPPLVTKWIEYHPKNVKLAFLAIGNAGDPPPYSGWKLIGYSDILTNTEISWTRTKHGTDGFCNAMNSNKNAVAGLLSG